MGLSASTAERIAAFFGGDPREVAEIVDRANAYRLLFRGIRSERRVPQARTEGIAPVSPEGGDVSYWSTGSRVFLSGDGEGSGLATYGTTFFHYAHNRAGMAIVVAGQGALAQRGITVDWRPDDDVTIGKVVPPGAFVLAEVGYPAGERQEALAAVQRGMMGELLRVVRSYEPAHAERVAAHAGVF